MTPARISSRLLVALRKESVDRNDAMQIVVVIVYASLSARRAWIEISIDDLEPSSTRKSLSARRAWIEIRRAGGAADIDNRRSPQGERG